MSFAIRVTMRNENVYWLTAADPIGLRYLSNVDSAESFSTQRDAAKVLTRATDAWADQGNKYEIVTI